MREVRSVNNRFLRWSKVCQLLECDPESLEQHCARHEIPVTRLGPRTRGLLEQNYNLLLEKATKAGAA